MGREREITTIQHLLEAARLVTLTGAGGVGKTRTALRVAADSLADYPDGVWVVELASLAEPALVAQAVATTLGIVENHTRPLLQTLQEALTDKRLLLVVDNCEHLVVACAELTDALLRTCPALKILATSRESLRLAGETAWRVPSLSLSSSSDKSGEISADSEGVRLFVERAEASERSFTLTGANRAAVLQICQRLDGIPLAIELAAAWVATLSPEQINARLDNPFWLLSRGGRDVPVRHQTLRATVAWSYGLLEPTERRLFERLSVFAGGWTLEAAEAVCAGEVVAREAVLGLMAALVDKSLVLVQEHAGGTRCRLLEPLRQYAAERLEETEGATAVRDRHRDWCLALAEKAEWELWGPDQIACLDRLEAERDNLRAALAWSLSGARDPQAGLRLGAALWRFWDIHGYFTESDGWLERLLELPGAEQRTPARAHALSSAGYLAIKRGAFTHADTYLQESMALWEKLQDQRRLAMVHFFIGTLALWTHGDHDQAAAQFQESLALSRQWGPPWATYFSLMRLGDLARFHGANDDAADLYTESQALTRVAGEYFGGSRALLSLAYLRWAQADGDTARVLFEEALNLSLELGDAQATHQALDGLACIALTEGAATLAGRVFGCAAALRERYGYVLEPYFEAERERALATCRLQLGEVAFAAQFSDGRALTQEQGLAEALSPHHSTKSRSATSAGSASSAPLTRRELEVATLVAQGLTNREIATQLVVSARTVDAHIEHIRNKLGLRSRAHVAAWVGQHPLPV